MSPIVRDYLVYAAAVLTGFSVYLVLDRVLNIDFAFAILGGFVGIHLALLAIRRLFPPK
jgi:predicted Zn-dependent protease